LGLVQSRERDRVAGIDELYEANALDDATEANIQTRDDAASEHD
jgi:hypothetical protein